MIDGPQLTGLGAVLAALGAGIGAIIGRRNSRENLEVTRETAAVVGLKSVIEAQNVLYDNVIERLNAVEGDVADIRSEREIDAEWISLLREHILAGNPPPPPARPTRR